MTKKYALYPLIMAVVAQLCFLVIVTNTIQPLWGRTMILILPSLIFCTVGLFALSGKLSKDATIILTSVLTIFLFLASVFYVFLLSIWSANTETTDVRDYARVYDDIEDEKGVKNVFPKKIPDDAENIMFSYVPQLLQGGEVFELSYTTTEEKLTEWKTVLTREAEWIGSNKEWHEANHWGFHDEDSVRYHLDWDGGFNHGEMCYVLIDEETNRITFYYSEW